MDFHLNYNGIKLQIQKMTDDVKDRNGIIWETTNMNINVDEKINSNQN